MAKNYITLNLILTLILKLTSQTLLGMSCSNPILVASISNTSVGLNSLTFTSNDCLAFLGSADFPLAAINLNVYSPGTSCTYNNIPGNISSLSGASVGPSILAASTSGCLAYAPGSNQIIIFSPACSGCVFAQANILSFLFITALGFSNNNCLAAGNNEGNINIYSPISSSSCNYGPSGHNFTIPSNAQVNAIAFSPTNNNCLAIGDMNGNVFIYTQTSGCTYNTTPSQTIALGSQINSVAFSSIGCLAIADNSGRVTLYQPGANCNYSLTTTISGLTTPSSVTFSPNNCLAIGSNDGSAGKVGIYSPTSNCLYNTNASSIIQRKGNNVSAIAFSSVGCLAIAFSDAINIYSLN